MDFWQPLCLVASDQLEVVKAWLLAPGRNCLARNLLLEAMTQIVFDDPSREEEILAWLGEIMEALLKAGEEENIYDTRVAQKLAWLFLDFCRREYHDLIVRFAERPDFQPTVLGDLAAMEEVLLAESPVVR